MTYLTSMCLQFPLIGRITPHADSSTVVIVQRRSTFSSPPLALVLRVIVYVVCVISNYADKSRFMRIFAGVHTCAALLE